MSVNVKRLITPIICASAGFLTFIFMIMDYWSYGSSLGESGYESINRFFHVGSFLCVLSALALVFLFALAVLLFLEGGAAFAKEFAGFEVFKDPAILPRASKLTLKVYMIVNICAASFFTLYCLIEAGFEIFLGVGGWFLLLLGIGAFVTNSILTTRYASEIASEPVSYKCSSCGASAKEGEKFCSKCGSPVAVVNTNPVDYKCSSCGSPAKEGEKFCSKCGSPIMAVKPQEQKRFCCPSCGAPAKETDKFCGICGSSINPQE